MNPVERSEERTQESHITANQSLDLTVKTPVDPVRVYVHGRSGLTFDIKNKSLKNRVEHRAKTHFRMSEYLNMKFFNV